MSPGRSFVGTLLLVLVAAPAHAQGTGSITGIVTDASSLAGVSAVQVHVPTLQIGTLTQANGRYLLTGVPAGTHQVRIERIGYRAETRQVTVVAGQPSELNVGLSEDALALDEIVVTGTAGQARRREVGNAISQINVADVPEPVTSVEGLLQGRATGLRVTFTDASVGSGARIRLRGNVSVSQGNQPLIYIDGIRQADDAYRSGGNTKSASPLADINPSATATSSPPASGSTGTPGSVPSAPGSSR